jgi:predicted dehydrogenase
MRDWRRHTRNSGGFMLEKCCHDLDLYQGLVGSRPAYVASFGGPKSFVPENRPGPGELVNQVPPAKRASYAGRVDPFNPRWGGSNASEYDSDADTVDFQTALVEYQGGASLAFHTNTNVPDEFRRFAVIGTRGMAEGDFIRNYFRVTDARTSCRLVEISEVADDSTGHYGADAAMCHDLAAHMSGGTPLPVGIIDALEAGLTALAMDEARRTRQVVDMAETWARFDSFGLS